MFQNFFERPFILILHIVTLLIILVVCCAGIIIGAVILGIMGIDVPNLQLILNIASVPFMFFDHKIVAIIINIIVFFLPALIYFQLRKMKK
ncbi:hypothetical protein SRABI84_03951 [Peribacillus simplex]|nr:hypothetical protein SRABI84_03951 [Peribacillus simplex]